MSKNQRLEEILAGNPNQWSNFTATDFQNFLSSFLLPSSDYQGLLAELKRLGPRQVCQYQFKPNDIVWICRQCQKDDTCVLCNECYLGSNHDGHEVFFYHSAAGGCCDCGDCDAWSSAGFCTKHGKVHDDPTSFLPAAMRTTALEMFQLLLKNLIEFSKTCSQRSLFDLSSSQTYCLNFYYDDFHTINDFQSFYTSPDFQNILQAPPEEDLSLLQTRGFIRLRSNLTMSQISSIMPYLQNSGYTVRALSKQGECHYLATYLSLLWMESLSLACDGMCRLMGSIITSDLLHQIIRFDMYFDKQFAKSFHNLLLSLMADQPFKMTSGIAYTLAYSTLCQDYSKGYGLSGSSMFNLSVQFLNREVFVHEICYHYNFLQGAVLSLEEMIMTNSHQRGRYLNTSSPSSLELMEKQFFQSPAIIYRRYGSIVGDLKIIFVIPDICRLFASTCLSDWLVILDYLQELNPQLRSKDSHVLYEEKDWMHAFNLAIGIQSLFEYMLNWFSDVTAGSSIIKVSDSSTKQNHKTVEMISVGKVLEIIVNYVFNWQRKEKDFTPFLKDLLPIKRVKDAIFHPLGLPLSLSQSQVKSFHFPLHRFFAHVVVEVVKYPHLSDSLLQMKNILNGDLVSVMYLMKVGLRALSLSKEIECGLWRKNGVVMQHQLLNYSQPPFCRINYDLDVLLLQLTLSILPLPTFLTLYFLSFNGIAPYLFHSLHDSHYLSPFSQDMDYLPPLIAESLELLVNVVTELPPIPSEKVENRLLGKIRREWINRLAGGNTTYSQLQECLTCYPDSSKINSDELDRLLSEISTKQVINPLSPPNYTLKRDLWIEYDPCFPHIPKSLHQIAADRKPKPLKEEPMIKISPQATIHPFFLSLRDEMFFHEEFLSVLRQIFFSIARQKIAQTEVSDYHKGYFLHLLPLNDTVYSRAVQLLTLIVQSLLERKEEQSLSTSESNYETNKRKFFTFLLLETDSALEQKFPSFLRAMYDLHQVFKSSFDTRSDQYHLGWILQNCRELDSLCAEQLEMFERDSTSTIQNLHQEKVKKMEDSRSRQLGAMNEAAKKFLEMLGDVSSSDDEDENEVGKKEIKDESEEETEAGGSSLTKTGGSSLNPMDVEEDNLAEGSGKTPRKQSSGGVENESDEMNIASDVGTFTDHLCIICKIDRDDQNFVENRLGYLALIQSSSVLWPKSSATERKDNESLASSYAFHALELVPSPDKNKIQKINSCSSNAHVGFCGHLMHLDCYSRYQHTVKQKSTQQNHMIVDAELSYFPCPLCKRLCNGFFPHHTNKPDVIPPSPPLPPPPMSSTADLLTFTSAIVTPSNSHFSDPLSAMTVVNELWLNSNNLKQLYSCDRERTMILFPHMNELEGRIVWDSLIEEMFSNIENDSSRNANYPCELLTSSFAYTVAVDNSNHILPGYHLDEIQQLLQIHTSYLSEGEKGDSEKSFNIFPSLPSLFRHYLKYSPGKDEIKLFSYMILCLSEIVMLSKMETLVMNSLFHSILGKSSQLIDNHLNMEINDRFWIKYRIPALLVLPLFELIVLTSALDQLYYRQGVDMSVAGERFELIKILPWFGLAKLMQLLLPFQQQASSSAISSAKDLASFHPSLQKIFAVTMIQTMDIPSLSGKDYQKVVGEWLLFIRAVIHLHTRNTQKSVNPICTTYLQTLTNDPSLIEHFVHPITEETNITDEMIIAHAKMIGLDFILTDNWSEVAGRLVGDVMKAWMTDFGEYHHKYQRAMIASPPYPGNRTNDLLPNYYDLPEKRIYPSKGGRPHLIRLPEDYSKLHAIVASKCSFDYPVICLQCGAILNASGQGQCHAHSYSCGAGVGIFFLIQDCHIILSHGPRSCYFPSPYVDIYGEIHQQFRGKPLHLDSNRYAALEQIWLSHQIPTEVMRTRSNLNRIIINGYY